MPTYSDCGYGTGATGTRVFCPAARLPGHPLIAQADSSFVTDSSCSSSLCPCGPQIAHLVAALDADCMLDLNLQVSLTRVSSPTNHSLCAAFPTWASREEAAALPPASRPARVHRPLRQPCSPLQPDSTLLACWPRDWASQMNRAASPHRLRGSTRYACQGNRHRHQRQQQQQQQTTNNKRRQQQQQST